MEDETLATQYTLSIWANGVTHLPLGAKGLRPLQGLMESQVASLELRLPVR